MPTFGHFCSPRRKYINERRLLSDQACVPARVAFLRRRSVTLLSRCTQPGGRATKK
ncbi:hypothetical protein CSUI_005605, partial [Cystoisospora suis]